MAIVSVPSRGILFPNNDERKIKKCVFFVSVPSRDILFPNNSGRFDTNTQAKFPSPLGVSYFQINSLLFVCKI